MDQTIKVKVTIFINGENGIKKSDIKDNGSLDIIKKR